MRPIEVRVLGCLILIKSQIFRIHQENIGFRITVSRFYFFREREEILASRPPEVPCKMYPEWFEILVLHAGKSVTAIRSSCADNVVCVKSRDTFCRFEEEIVFHPGSPPENVAEFLLRVIGSAFGMYVENLIVGFHDSVHPLQRKTLVCGIIRAFCYDRVFGSKVGQVVTDYRHMLGNTCEETLDGADTLIGSTEENFHRLVSDNGQCCRIAVDVIEDVRATGLCPLESFVLWEPCRIYHVSDLLRIDVSDNT